MKTMMVISTLAIVFSSISAHAGKHDSTATGEKVGDTKVVSIDEAGTAGRLADRLIIRSNAQGDKTNLPRVANVYADHVEYTQGAGKLSQLSSLSQEVLQYLASNGKCDSQDSDCIVFEDSKDSAYRIVTTPSQDGSVAVMMGAPEQWGAGRDSTKGLANRIDHTTHTRSVIYTRSSSSY